MNLRDDNFWLLLYHDSIQLLCFVLYWFRIKISNPHTASLKFTTQLKRYNILRKRFIIHDIQNRLSLKLWNLSRNYEISPGFDGSMRVFLEIPHSDSFLHFLIKEKFSNWYLLQKINVFSHNYLSSAKIERISNTRILFISNLWLSWDRNPNQM